MDALDKKKVLQSLAKKANEKTGSNVKIGSECESPELLDTPFPSLNSIMGGIPKGRFTTIAGPQHTGKGALILQIIAHHQHKDPNFFVLWTDAENSFDFDWARTLGVDLDRVVMQKYTEECNTMEKMLDTCLKIVQESKIIDMWVIDSIGALVPKNDIYDSKDVEKSLEGDKMLNLQRKLGEFFRKANVIVSPTAEYKGCAVICVGQIYTVPDAHTTLEEVKGGNAFKHWAHLRLMLRRGPKSDWPEPIEIMGIDGKKRKIYPGWAGRIRVDKTRINDKEGHELLLTFMLGRGFDSKAAVISAGFGFNLFERSGPIYTCDLLPGGKIKGKENLIQFFMNDENAFKQLVERVDQLALSGDILNKELLNEGQPTDGTISDNL